jgi:hypothetical protein
MGVPRRGRLAGTRRRRVTSHRNYRSVFGDRSTDRSDVTELPELTSDSVCTADRRGGILIFSGPIRNRSRGYNPFEAGRDPVDGTVDVFHRSRLRSRSYPNPHTHLSTPNETCDGSHPGAHRDGESRETANKWLQMVWIRPQVQGNGECVLPLRAGSRPEGGVECRWRLPPHLLHSIRMGGKYIRPSNRERYGTPYRGTIAYTLSSSMGI